MNLFSKTTAPAVRLRNKLVSFVKNSQAVAAVEFALIAPILLILFIGTVEVSLMVSVDRKLSRTSSSIADLVTQGGDFSSVAETQRLRELFGITERIMYPYTNRIPCIVITIVEARAENDTNGDGVKNNDDVVTAKVIQSIDNKTPHPSYVSPPVGQCEKSSVGLDPDENARQERLADSEFILPEAINTHGANLVIAEVEYDHKPIIGFINYATSREVSFDTGAVTLGDRIYLRPRNGSVNF